MIEKKDYTGTRFISSEESNYLMQKYSKDCIIQNYTSIKYKLCA